MVYPQGSPHSASTCLQLHQKKYNPPYPTTHQLCIRAFPHSHQSPLPSQINWTVGTLSYNYRFPVFHSWDLSSYFVGEYYRNFVQLSYAQQRIIYRLLYLLFSSGWLRSNSTGLQPWCWIGISPRPLLLCWIGGSSRGQRGGGQGQNSFPVSRRVGVVLLEVWKVVVATVGWITVTGEGGPSATGLVMVLSLSDWCDWDHRRMLKRTGGGGGASSVTTHIGGDCNVSGRLMPSSWVTRETTPEDRV